MHCTALMACVVQVNQADLIYVHPAAREAAGGARAALGNDYEMQLRSEAGPMPGKLAKRKHQISSLYHHAKIRVSVCHTAPTLPALPADLLSTQMLHTFSCKCDYGWMDVLLEPICVAGNQPQAAENMACTQ